MKNKTRILFIGYFLSAKGKGHSVTEDVAARMQAWGHAVERASGLTAPLLRAAHMVLAALFKKYDIAVVDVYSGRAFEWAAAVSLCLKLRKKPFIFMLHGGNLPLYANANAPRFKKIMARASRLAAPSRFMARGLEPLGLKIGCLPNPVEIKNYAFRLRDRPRPHLLWLRAFHPVYRPELAAEAAGLLGLRFPDTRLTMAGPDKNSLCRAEAEETARKHGANVSFKGWVPKNEVPALLNQADIFLNTPDVDNMPVSVLEAMACGLCIVSTRVGGIEFLLEDEKTALLVPPNDAAALAEAAARLLSEPGLAAKLSANARKSAEKMDWSEVLPLWEKTFEEIAV